MSENSNISVNGPACVYNTLGRYNGSSSVSSMGHPQVAPTTVSGVYIVPDYGSIGYNTLSDYGNSCSGYPTIGAAYGKGANNCSTTYSKKLCGN